MGKDAREIEALTATFGQFDAARTALCTKIRTAIDAVTADSADANISEETRRIAAASHLAEITSEMRDLLQNFAAQYPTTIYQDFLKQTGKTELHRGVASQISTMLTSTTRNATKCDEQTNATIAKTLATFGATPYEFVFLNNEAELSADLAAHIGEIKHLFAYKSFSPQILDYAQMQQLSSVYLFGRALEQDERDVVASCARSGSITRLNISMWGEEIASNAFKDSVNLAELIGFTNLATIGESAFQGCTGLRKLILPDTIRTVGTNAFAATAISEILVPNGITNFAPTAFTDATIGKFTFQEGITNISYIKNIITPVTCTVDVHFPGSLGSIV
ncbi:MAG: leucine-rich repeat domain-containing protein, partial [Holosporales bacterium]|nr:leucine-rich repeat domain-containing protein [Holosporales bacterium]